MINQELFYDIVPCSHAIVPGSVVFNENPIHKDVRKLLRSLADSSPHSIDYWRLAFDAAASGDEKSIASLKFKARIIFALYSNSAAHCIETRNNLERVSRIHGIPHVTHYQYPPVPAVELKQAYLANSSYGKNHERIALADRNQEEAYKLATSLFVDRIWEQAYAGMEMKLPVSSGKPDKVMTAVMQKMWTRPEFASIRKECEEHALRIVSRYAHNPIAHSVRETNGWVEHHKDISNYLASGYQPPASTSSVVQYEPDTHARASLELQEAGYSEEE